MRQLALVILTITVTALVVCADMVRRSGKNIARSVWLLLVSLIPPVMGNVIIIASTSQLPAVVGYYIYFLGMDLMAAFLLKFSIDYCSFSWDNKTIISLAYSLITIDIIQYALNPHFHQAFSTEETMVDGTPYFHLLPYIGQSYHRLIVYGFFFASLIMFAVKVARTSRVYNQKYRYILTMMILTGFWESYYIFSGMPIDTSMIGFGIFGLLVSYFALYYRPSLLISDMMNSIASGLPEALLFFNTENKCIWTNEAGLKLLGLGEHNYEEATEKMLGIFPDLANVGDEYRACHVIGTGKDRKYYDIEKHVARDKTRKGQVIGSFISIFDDTEDHRKFEEERYNARHDKLTGLYNKEYTYRRIREILESNPHVPYLVAFVDVNEFKMVNDVFGKEFGDYALQQIAAWISNGMPSDTVYGRLGGDTFGVLQPVSQFDPEKINKVLDNFVVKQGEKEHRILIHVGIYQIDDLSIDVSVMFDRARMALSKIKRLYSHVAYYNDSIRESILWNQKISAELQDAIDLRQIKPYFQPILDASGKVVGAEELTRWQHPERGLLSPAVFIPVFEQNGRIVDLDKYMWRCACEQLKEWESTRPDLFVSVNISPVDFYYIDVESEIRSLIDEFGIQASRLRLEITEAVMMSNLSERIQTINRLKQDGFVVEMDDFGSGYSSLNMLKDMPVDLIKLDMEFLHDSMFNDKAKTILNSIVALIEMLGMDSLVEGVETKEQFELLSGMGCMYFQGYYFSKPLPIEKFEEYCEILA